MNQRDDTATLRVTNISENTREEDLRELFRPFGAISRCYLAMDKVHYVPGARRVLLSPLVRVPCQCSSLARQFARPVRRVHQSPLCAPSDLEYRVSHCVAPHVASGGAHTATDVCCRSLGLPEGLRSSTTCGKRTPRTRSTT